MNVYRQGSSLLLKEPSRAPWPFNPPSWSFMGLVLMLSKRELLRVCSSKSCIFLVNSYELVQWWIPENPKHRNQVLYQRQYQNPELLPPGPCFQLPVFWNWKYSTNLNLVSAISWLPNICVKNWICFHIFLSLPLISSYLWGIGMCHRLPWALPQTFHEQQSGFESLPPLGTDTKERTGTFSLTSLQAKELYHIDTASVFPGPRKSWGHSSFNQHIKPAPAQPVTVLISHHVTVVCHEMSSASYSFSRSIIPVGRQDFQRNLAV